MMSYKLSLQLLRLYNSANETDVWIDLNVQQNFNGRNSKVQILNTSVNRIRKNLLVNKMCVLNGKIEVVSIALISLSNILFSHSEVC